MVQSAVTLQLISSDEGPTCSGLRSVAPAASGAAKSERYDVPCECSRESPSEMLEARAFTRSCRASCCNL